MPELFLVEKPVRPQQALPDAAEREAALDIHASWLVEAPAGSGKTGLLMQRFLKLLADDSVTMPEQVLAITFTRKATAELRERVLMQLEAAAKQIAPANDFDRATRPLALGVLDRDAGRDPAQAWNLLEEPRRLNIRTIDSVCSEIANSLPILSGSGGRRSPVEDASPFYAIAARRTLMQLGGSDQALNAALRLVLLHRDGSLTDCERLLAGMLALREQWGEIVPLGRTELDDESLDTIVLPKLERALDQVICAALTQLAKTIPHDILNDLTTAAADMAHLDGYSGRPSPLTICAGRHGSPGSTAEDLAHWRALVHLLIAPSTKSWRKVFSKNIVGFNTGKFEQEQLKQIVRRLEDRDDLLQAICRLGALPPAKYPEEQWRVAKALFRVLSRALAELQIVFAERGECDYAELALAARTALASEAGDGEPALEAALGIHLQHLLVDEMQDTSSSQYELIQLLTAGWDGRGQTAFLVGDPKQSIYLFRQARVERFLRTMRSEHLGNLPLGCLRLTANFRSQPALVDDFNADFAAIFPSLTDHLHPEEVPYVQATAARVIPRSSTLQPTQGIFSITTPCNGLDLAASATATPRIWHPHVLPYDPSAFETHQQRRSDAAEIRSIVEQWQARPLPPGRIAPWKIAVLVRNRNHLEEIVAAFKEGPGIPFRAVEIEPLRERPEVQDLIALTRALLHPADRVAWLAILRAPWCGLSLAELHRLAGGDDRAFAQRSLKQVIAERGDLLDSEACLRLERLWPILEAAAAMRGRAPLSQIVERTWRAFGGDAYCFTPELANARRYIQLLEQMEQEAGIVELEVLDRRLEKLFAAPIAHTDAVDLMTIHGAKGLEWDVVIVPALERLGGSNRSHLLTWLELDSADEAAAHVLLAPIAGRGEESRELNKWIASIHFAREAAERKRLFYVACTRAREELHLFAAPSRSSKGEVCAKPASLLHAAWAAACPVFTAAATRTQLEDSLIVEVEDQPTFDIAASPNGEEEAEDRPTLLQRLPIAFDPAARFVNPYPFRYGDREETASAPHFERPEGSFTARALGNAVHAFLEVIADRIAAGATAPSLIDELPEWTPRIATILRSEGLPPSAVERLAQGVLFALESTLNDPTGRWLLSAHADAASEYALTAWRDERSSIRVDRIFRAGDEPLAPGTDHLWIVDYKTTTHGAEGIEEFLIREREKYAPQLEAYARIVSTESRELKDTRLALYYPMLPRLTWWPSK